MRTRQIETDSATYTVYVDGDDRRKPYAVYLHGGPGFNCFGERQVLGSRFASAANVLWFDQLGCAESPAKHRSKVALDPLVDDVAAIARSFTDEPVHVLGHCSGSSLTHELVRRHRSMIRSAVWLAPLASPSDLFKGLLRRSVDEGRLDPALLPSDERDVLERLASAPGAELGAAEAAAILTIAGKIHDFWGLYWTDRSAMARHLAWFEERPFAPLTFVEIVAQISDRASRSWPSYDGIPTLMLYDHDDRVAPWREHGARLASHIPHARTRVVRNGYHWLQFQQPDACVASTLAFWSELS